MNIAVTGFYGTGSSAVIDLLREYSDVKCAIGERYEHYPFLLKNCLFDLENRIFAPSSNYMIIDYALNEFYEEMLRQNNNCFGWYGSYKSLFNNKFLDLVNDFLENISELGDTQSFSYSKGVKFSFIKCGLQLGAKILKGRTIYKWGRVFTYRKKKMRFLKVNQDEFLKFSKLFIDGYFQLCNIENKKFCVYDHLLLPEQTKIVDKFFDDNFRFIIVDRDPRDVYISSKYIWSTVAMGMQKAPFPLGVDGFCRHWANMHFNIDKSNSDNILYLKFEDLIYDYENTIAKIEKFCGLNSNMHMDQKIFFNPEKSINNTQVFKLDKKFIEETKVIEKNLKSYLYDFKYDLKSNIKDVFDC